MMKIASIPRLAAALACLAAALPTPLPADEPAPADLEARVEAALRRLDDDAFATRAAALDELAGLGAGAVPLLEKRIDGLSPEARAGARTAIRRIRADEALARVLPPVKRVTLDLKDRPVTEALEEVQSRTGLPLDFRKLTDGSTVTLSIRDALPLQALDEICRRAGGVTYEWTGRNRSRRGGDPDKPATPRLRFQSGDPPEGPAAYARHYRFAVTQVSTSRSLRIPGNSSSQASLVLSVVWPPNVQPDSMSDLRLSALEDRKGRSLLEEDAAEEEDPRSYQGVSEPGGASRHVSFLHPAADAGGIRSLKGSVSFRYPAETRVIRFPKPSETPEARVAAEGFTVILREFRLREKTARVDLEVSWSGDPDQDGGSLRRGDLPFSHERIELASLGGAVWRTQSVSINSSDDTYRFKMDFTTDRPEEVTEIRIPCVLSRIEDEVEFEIRDIPLPD